MTKFLNCVCPLTLAAIAAAGLMNAKAQAALISSSDLLVFQQGTTGASVASAGSTPLVIDEINPSLTAQTTPVQTFNITTSATTPLYTSNEGSDGTLSLSNGGTQVSFSGWEGTNSTENKVLSRAAAAIDSSGNITESAAYTGVTGNQTRSAYSPDGVNYYISDKKGIYVQGGSAALINSLNTRSIKSYNGNVYALQQTTPVVSLLTPTSPAGATTVSYTALPGLQAVADTSAVDFAMVSLGNDGPGVPDVMYVTDGTGISKYANVSGTWQAESSDTAPGATLNGITAVPVVGGVDLYVTSNPTGGASVVEEVTDTSAYNANIADSTAVTLYTAPANDLLRGVSIAPVPEPASLSLLALAGVGLLGRRRRMA